jgi:hypothetical protein
MGIYNVLLQVLLSVESAILVVDADNVTTRSLAQVSNPIQCNPI